MITITPALLAGCIRHVLRNALRNDLTIIIVILDNYAYDDSERGSVKHSCYYVCRITEVDEETSDRLEPILISSCRRKKKRAMIDVWNIIALGNNNNNNEKESNNDNEKSSGGSYCIHACDNYNDNNGFDGN